MKVKNSYYDMKEILTSNPIPHNCKYDNKGSIIKNHLRKWCIHIIKQRGKAIRRINDLARKAIMVKK